ncbi:MAG: FxDxF family PEP-CTERM protein, partial [Methyloversatilis sp.]|nr:FxDxF family PEP-CTERM protein [Methyloversatilis sp.]
TITAVSKTLLLDLSDLKNDDGSTLALDNIEGLTFGPSFNGKQTLILASDNNFGATQFTQFIALEVTAVPEPETYAMLLAGLGLIGVAARRRSNCAQPGPRATLPADPTPRCSAPACDPTMRTPP